MKNLILITLLLVTYQTILAQETFSIESKYLNERTPFIVQKPDNYETSKKYPLVYMLHGYSENYEQWNKTTDLKKLANDYQMILVCPEGFVSYYLNSPKLKNLQYEDFFFKELVPEIEKYYSIDSNNIFITGLSMGGYGALSLFIKNPDFFNTASSTSGALEFDYDNLEKISNMFFKNERMTNDLEKSLGNPSKNDWNELSISTLLEQNTNFNKGFLIDCGLQDPLLSNTLKVKELALSKNLPIRFSTQPGGHNTEYWKKSIEYHFVYFQQHLKTE
jgi:S-formylglutathione hydrolase FrmB